MFIRFCVPLINRFVVSDSTYASVRALAVGYMCSRAFHWLCVFLRLLPAICFPALVTGYMFSRACHRLYVYPRLPEAKCFPALATGYIFTRACQRLNVFPRLPQAICFPALPTDNILIRSPAFAADHLFSRAYRFLVLLPRFGWLQVLLLVLFTY